MTNRNHESIIKREGITPMSTGETRRLHPLYFFLWAWIVPVAGATVSSLVEVALKKTGHWQGGMFEGWQSNMFGAMELLFIAVSSYGLIPCCPITGKTSIARCISALFVERARMNGARTDAPGEARNGLHRSSSGDDAITAAELIQTAAVQRDFGEMIRGAAFVRHAQQQNISVVLNQAPDRTVGGPDSI